MFRIRTATAKDAQILARLHAEIFPEDAWTVEWFASRLRQERMHFLIAEDGDTPVGISAVSTVADEAEILTIGLLSTDRRKGYGDQLLRSIFKLPVNHFFLEVAADNQAAIEMYKSAGFYETGRRRAYYKAGTDAIIMMLSQPSP
ncbi:MAG: ribosomal protein S18-alanine N-acetyltransferase [Aquisalinus sp.]|nr:ribosomal protein S18-alanine N-acetyltransferase [Aquisalinus sp.]